RYPCEVVLAAVEEQAPRVEVLKEGLHAGRADPRLHDVGSFGEDSGGNDVRPAIVRQSAGGGAVRGITPVGQSDQGGRVERQGHPPRALRTHSRRTHDLTSRDSRPSTSALPTRRGRSVSPSER